MLEAQNLSFSYKKSAPIFENVSFHIDDGEIVSIMGPNGAGKSTLLKCINKINKPSGGKILLNGRDTGSYTDRELSRLIGYVPQDIGGGFAISVVEAVMLGRTPFIRFRATQHDKDIVFEMLYKFGLENYAFSNLNELSGGERQRVFLARAMVQDPRVMLLDEPISNLDVRYQIETLDLIKSIVKERNLISIMVIHDLSFAYRYSDSVIMMKKCTPVIEGKRSIITEQTIADIYQVEASVHHQENYPYINPKKVV